MTRIGGENEMKLMKQYLELRTHFEKIKESEEIAITVDELATILDCTHRNVMLLLGRMRDQDWIQWIPKRGRGNRSGLFFLMSLDSCHLQFAQHLVEKKDLQSALEQINSISVSSATKQQFHHWLSQTFGYQTEVTDHHVKIDTLRFPLSGPLFSLDPIYTNFASESHLVRQIFDNLVHYNALKQTIEARIAHFWEVNEAGTLWTFYLRKGILFHHGRVLTAEDVQYSLLRAKQSTEKSLYRWIYHEIDRVEALDSTTIRIHLKAPNSLFLPFLSTHRTVIVPKEVCEASIERFGKQPIGTGPFKLISNDQSMCVLEAFPHYYLGRAHLDRVEIWNIPALYKQDHRKLFSDFQVIHNLKVSDSVSTLDQVKHAGTTCKFITFNTLKSGRMLDSDIRLRIKNILHTTYIVENLQAEAKGDEALFLTLDGFVGSSDNKNQYIQNSFFESVLSLCTIPHYEKDARLIQTLCQDAGIQMEIILLTPEEFKGDQRLEADLILFAIVLDHDAELRLVDLYKSMQQHLEPSANKVLDELLEKIIAEPSMEKRTTLFNKIETYLKTKGWIHFLYQKKQKTVFHHSVKGISFESLGWVQFRDIWFKE